MKKSKKYNSETQSPEEAPPTADALPPPPRWDETLFGDFTDNDLSNTMCRSGTVDQEVWNRLCWAVTHSSTREEFLVASQVIGTWVDSLHAEYPNILQHFSTCDIHLQENIKALPEGRRTQDVSRRKREMDKQGRIYVYQTTDEAEVGDKAVAALAHYSHERGGYIRLRFELGRA